MNMVNQPIAYQTLLDARDRASIPHTILAIDPGGTAGVAILVDGVPVEAGQIGGEYGAVVRALHNLIADRKPDLVVIEEYRVYRSMTAQHANSDIPTLRMVGAMEHACMMLTVPLIKQMAFQAKQSVTDLKLRQWKFWQPGSPHANDAIRHGIRHVLTYHAYHKRPVGVGKG